MKQTHSLKFIPYIIIGLLLIAIAHLPYGYYTFLRIVIFIYTGILAYQYLTDEKYTRGLVFATIGIIYNPIFPIHLTKSIRIIINLIVAGTIITYLILQNKRRKEIQKRIDTNFEKEEKIDEFFKQNPEAQKELEDEIKSRQTKSKKTNSNKEIIRCATPYFQIAKEKIYDKYNK